MLYNPRPVSRGAVRVRRLWHYCFHYKLGLLCSSNGSRQQSDGAGVVVGVGGSGHPVPALVLWMATRWKEECGRTGGNHQGEWLILSFFLFLMWMSVQFQEKQFLLWKVSRYITNTCIKWLNLAWLCASFAVL